MINFNGQIVEAQQAAIPLTSRACRYGEGLFETIKVINNRIPLFDFHIERLFQGADLLGFKRPEKFVSDHIKESILKLCGENIGSGPARVRLHLFNHNARLSVNENDVQFAIEAEPLEINPKAFDRGLVIDIFPKGRKSCDPFSNLKSHNHLLYAMAFRFAHGQALDDALVLNAFERVADSSIANVYWVSEGKIYTPPLTEGPVAGVMRRYLMQKFDIVEEKLEVKRLLSAEECFLTNAVRGIMWVKSMRETRYQQRLSRQIHQSLSFLH